MWYFSQVFFVAGCCQGGDRSGMKSCDCWVVVSWMDTFQWPDKKSQSMGVNFIIQSFVLAYSRNHMERRTQHIP